MSKVNDLSEISQKVEKLYLEEEELFRSSEDWRTFAKSYLKFHDCAYNEPLPFDPRFNAVHWGFWVSALCREIAFSYCWMNAYAKYYKSQVRPKSKFANVDFKVSYFADNSIIRINSCRDKIALMIWAFYCPFNPKRRSEILDYAMVLERLKYPLRFGLTLKNHQRFVRHLETLQGQDFNRMVAYRHLKVHRMEPRIEIYGVKSFHDWPYMFPLYKPAEIARFEQEIRNSYPKEEQEFVEQIIKNCHLNGVLFEHRKIDVRLWNYDEVQTQIRSCLTKLLQVTAGCFDILRRRAPLRERRKRST